MTPAGSFFEGPTASLAHLIISAELGIRDGRFVAPNPLTGLGEKKRAAVLDRPLRVK